MYEDPEVQQPASGEKIYADRSSFQNPALRERRYAEREFPILGWVMVQSLYDKEYTRIQSKIYKRDGNVDKMLAQRAASELVIATVVNPQTRQTYLVENDVDTLRSIDSAIMDALVGFCREHVGVRDEEEAKN